MYKEEKISVIICTHNRASYIVRAVNSVLAQTHKNIELIIVDDASTDNTKDVLDQYKNNASVKIFKNDSNLGISESRNKGVSLASGTYIAVLDSDDYWTDPQKLEKQVAILESNPHIGIVGSAITCITPDGEKIKDAIYKLKDVAIRDKILIKNQFAHSAVLFRKDAFLEVGGYDLTLTCAQDFDVWLKIGRNHAFANLKESTVAYLINPHGISQSKKLQMAYDVNKIIETHKHFYPNYWKAKIVSLARILKTYL